MKHSIPLDLTKKNVSYLQSKFSWLNNVNLRVYSTPELAISELCNGLSMLYSHKNQFYIHSGESPYLNGFAEFLSKKNFKIINDINILDDSCIACLLPQDNPLTGEIFDHSEIIESCKKKRIFVILVNHLSFLTSGYTESNDPYISNIYCFHPYKAFSSLGSRSKKILSLSHRTEVSISESDFMEVMEDRNRVLEFEEYIKNSIPESKFFYKNETRIYDRAIFCVEGENGDYLLNQLGLKNSYTSCPCFLAHPYQLSWWSGFSESTHWIFVPVKEINDELRHKVDEYKK